MAPPFHRSGAGPTGAGESSLRPFRILFTNQALAHPAGTETYTRDATLALRERGHEVAVFSPNLGAFAERLAAAGIFVCSDPSTLRWTPQLIHGHHGWETTIAALRWPSARVLSFCHGAKPWQETLCLAPWVQRYVAVDEATSERIEAEVPRSAGRLRVVRNSVDLRRFKARAPLPACPQRALVISNHASEKNYLPVIREACAAAGIEVEAAGGSVGRTVFDPENLLGDFDVVFAKGRAALEGMAVGCAVVLCDIAGLGPMISRREWPLLRRRNFGFRCLTGTISVDEVSQRLRDYDSVEAAAVSRLVRNEASLETMVDELEVLYEEALLEPHLEPGCSELAEFAVEHLLRASQWHSLGQEVAAALDALTGEQAWQAVRQMLKSQHKVSEEKLKLRTRIENLESKLADARPKPTRGRWHLSFLSR